MVIYQINARDWQFLGRIGIGSERTRGRSLPCPRVESWKASCFSVPGGCVFLPHVDTSSLHADKIYAHHVFPPSGRRTLWQVLLSLHLHRLCKTLMLHA
jgi:hypothetical protein